MPWTREFIEPIILTDGRSLSTLAEARAFIKALPPERRRTEHWLYAEGLLAEAAIGRGGLPEATAQMKGALKVEGLI